MSLTRELLVIFFAVISAVNIASAGFLTMRRVLIVPGTHPALTQVQQIARAPKVLPQMIRFEARKKHTALPVASRVMNRYQWSMPLEGMSLTLNQWSGRDQGIVMYSHNWLSLLGPLQQSRLGDVITLAYGGGRPDEYVIKAHFTVTPDRIDILRYIQPGTLLLYSREGWFDQQRTVVIAQRQLATPASQTISLHDPQTNPIFTVK